MPAAAPARRLLAVLAACLPLAACSGASGSTHPTPKPNTAKPAARTGAAAAWDEKRGQLVMFGGENPDPDNHQTYSDTWTWDTGGWHQQKLKAAPYARRDAGAAYDPDTGMVVMAAGNSGAPTYDDTWLWDGKAWTQGQELQGAHFANDTASMVWDPGHHQLVLVVCCDGFGSTEGVLTYTGDGRTWQLRDTVHLLDPHTDLRTAFDPTTGEVLLLDADDGSVTGTPAMWSWDGSDWTRLQTAPPAGTAFPSTVKDPISLLALSPGDGRVLDVMEGASGPGSSFVEEGGGWQPVAAGSTPVRLAALVSDVHDGRVIAIGGPSDARDTDHVLQRTSGGWGPAGPVAKAAYALPSFPVPAPRPVMAVHAAKDYVPGAAQFGAEYGPFADAPPGAIASRDLGPEGRAAVDSWEVLYQGNDAHLLTVDVVVFPGSLDAANYLRGLSSSVVGQGDAGVLTPPAIGENAEMFREALTLVDGTKAALVHVAWREGRVAFEFVYRDFASSISPAPAAAGARLIDRLALQLARG